MSTLVNFIFYHTKPLIPRKIQIWIRRKIAKYKRNKYSDNWPIDSRAAQLPVNWKGWPGHKKFALILTHDVESQIGHDRTLQLMEIEKSLGFRSSFNFVPEKYKVSKELRKTLEINGFEVGLHGLNHDGKLFLSKKNFDQRSKKINMYIKDWKAVGFRAPAMHHNLEWLKELDIEYDLSTFDTDPFEPQCDAVHTIFPFIIYDNSKYKYLEMPYTLVQDFTLFILMEEKNIEVWKRKVDWIVKHGGMVLLNTHPDYMSFNNHHPKFEEYSVDLYLSFLKYIKESYSEEYFHVLPKEMMSIYKGTSVDNSLD